MIKSSFPHYYKYPVINMGRWHMAPLDCENWNTELSSHNFYKIFGVYKGTLVINDLRVGAEHAYFPKYFFKTLHQRIDQINKQDYKALARMLQQFYTLKPKAKEKISSLGKIKNLKKLSTKELWSIYDQQRQLIQLVTVYDQLAWLAEDYWNKKLPKILINKLKLKAQTMEYNKALFTLTKPQEISTTLEEKRDSLKETLKIKTGIKTLNQSAKFLAKKYGWMPVFAFGDSWDDKHYIKQLNDLCQQPEKELRSELLSLINYTKLQQVGIKELVTKYKITEQDLQLFIDFGLALDTRNEAEYLVSLYGMYIRPFYDEFARRLFISVTQLRNLVQIELKESLLGKVDVHQLLAERHNKVIGWGFNYKMDKRSFIPLDEINDLFKHLSKKSVSMYEQVGSKGVCANSGKIIAKVKILSSPAENDKVKSGEIMICHTTTVDYLPAMKKAAAFVTEMGGLTCHAAVVAREFGVPCIVSLKNATKNFKDGDKVELNADLGIMKKIK